MRPFQRQTRQRQTILEELQRQADHPTAFRLYETVRKRLPKISLGTIYRNLELLARAGIVQKLEVCGGESRFDGNARQHDHVRCLGCGRVDDIHKLPIDLEEGAVKNYRGYEVVGHRLELLGYCPKCRAVRHESDGMKTRAGRSHDKD
jgi:Fe2+ or Zn2+ uptake regulation protein